MPVASGRFPDLPGCWSQDRVGLPRSKPQFQQSPTQTLMPGTEIPTPTRTCAEANGAASIDAANVRRVIRALTGWRAMQL